MLAHLEFQEADAIRHWDEFKNYHARFEKDLGYPIDTRISTLSYFINENKQLTNPKIIEMKVFQSTQDKVILDELTSLYNYRHFRERIKAEMESAVEREEMLSLIIVDIDNFKHVNDDYGHLAGDGILRQIAMLMKTEVSNEGETFRYGGEEFAEIVPRAGKPEVYDLANNLCEKIAEHAFINENRAPRREMSITASLGIAAYPQDCDNSDALVLSASVPGLNPDDIHINLEDDVLTIEGEFAHNVEDVNYLIRERASEGRFQRSVRINVSVMVDEIAATFDNGILTLTVPKAPEAKPLSIPVKKIED